MFKGIADGFGYLFGLLGDMALFLLQGIVKILQPILDLIGALFYFVFKLGVVLVKVINLVISVGRLLIGLIIGLFKTLSGFSFSGKSAIIPASYQSAFDHLRPLFQLLQLDKLAYIFIFSIWLFTATAAVRKIRNMGGGSG